MTRSTSSKVVVEQKYGREVSIDAAGNIIGKRKGKNNNLPSIAFGSHIDSVPGGGNYDGDVGSLGAIECVQLMKDNNIMQGQPEPEIWSICTRSSSWAPILTAQTKPETQLMWQQFLKLNSLQDA